MYLKIVRILKKSLVEQLRNLLGFLQNLFSSEKQMGLVFELKRYIYLSVILTLQIRTNIIASFFLSENNLLFMSEIFLFKQERSFLYGAAGQTMLKTAHSNISNLLAL